MTAGVQIVHLEDAIYMGRSNNFGSTGVLYKYHMVKKSWNKLQTKAAGYALATYRSKVVMIAGILSKQSQDAYNESVTVLDDDCGLEEKLNSSLQQAENVGDYFKFKNGCAASDGDYLIAIGGKGPELSLGTNQRGLRLRVFDGEKWSFATATLNSNMDLGSMHYWTLHVLNDEVYAAIYDSCSIRKVFHTPLESLKGTSDGNMCQWNQVDDCYGNYHLAVLGNHLVRLRVSGGVLQIYAYLPSSSKWVNVENVPIALQCVTCVVDLHFPTPSEKMEALIVGRRSDHSPASVLRMTTKCMLPILVL